MEFDLFIQRLSQALTNPLPGIEAQLELAPYKRRNGIINRETPSDAKRSAVLSLIYPLNNEPTILLILRKPYKGVHSSQVSFPGGKKEPEDVSYQATATRETHEEVGISPSAINILGQLTQVYIPPSNFLVYPYIGFCNQLPQLTLSEREVEKVIHCPVSKLIHPKTLQEKELFVQTIQQKIKTPSFQISGETVWGATAMMLSELKAIITPIWKG